MTASFHQVAPGICVIERGWLNCNQVLLSSHINNVLIDSGYGRHADATIGFVELALAEHSKCEDRRVHRLINTHCHSDHMGGNAALRARYDCRITIPIDEVKHVQPWTAQSCWSEMTGQYAEPFDFDDTISPGESFIAGEQEWRAFAAPGHDMDAIMFHSPDSGVLITGDALWHIKHGGMGFVWPHLDDESGRNAFIDAAFETLRQIEALNPCIVIPGHGVPFGEVKLSIDGLRERLNALSAYPEKNARHVVKAMLVFSLLDIGQMALTELPGYLSSVPIYCDMNAQFLHMGFDELAKRVAKDLVAVGAIRIDDGVMRATMRV